MAGADPREALAALGSDGLPESDSDVAQFLLARIGISGGSAGLPSGSCRIMALVEALPHGVSERLLIELMARLVEPLEP